MNIFFSVTCSSQTIISPSLSFVLGKYDTTQKYPVCKSSLKMKDERRRPVNRETHVIRYLVLLQIKRISCIPYLWVWLWLCWQSFWCLSSCHPTPVSPLCVDTLVTLQIHDYITSRTREPLDIQNTVLLISSAHQGWESEPRPLSLTLSLLYPQQNSQDTNIIINVHRS